MSCDGDQQIGVCPHIGTLLIRDDNRAGREASSGPFSTGTAPELGFRDVRPGESKSVRISTQARQECHISHMPPFADPQLKLDKIRLRLTVVVPTPGTWFAPFAMEELCPEIGPGQSMPVCKDKPGS